MKRAELREYTFLLLYCRDFHPAEEMPRQYDLFWQNLETEAEEINREIENNAFLHELLSKDAEEKTIGERDSAFADIREQDKQFVMDRVSAITSQLGVIDAGINKVAKKWTTERMSKVDLTILRLAYFEMQMDDEIPQRVAIDQAVELAKKYGSDDSASFVNGILARVYAGDTAEDDADSNKDAASKSETKSAEKTVEEEIVDGRKIWHLYTP